MLEEDLKLGEHLTKPQRPGVAAWCPGSPVPLSSPSVPRGSTRRSPAEANHEPHARKAADAKPRGFSGLKNQRKRRGAGWEGGYYT